MTAVKTSTYYEIRADMQETYRLYLLYILYPVTILYPYDIYDIR